MKRRLGALAIGFVVIAGLAAVGVGGLGSGVGARGDGDAPARGGAAGPAAASGDRGAVRPAPAPAAAAGGHPVQVAEARSGRAALVIGNGAYREVGSLANPPNDARALASALQRLDFRVIVGIDLDRDGVFGKLDELARTVDAGVDLGLVFYAGHGVQIEGRNYLLPVDIRQDRDPRRDAIPVEDVLATLEGVRRLKLVILDACRNNPLRSVRIGNRALSIRSGLTAPPAVAGDTLIAYATRADDVAGDGADRNSPYTTALLTHLETPGLALERLFGKVRDSVMVSTHNGQQPFTYGSLGGEPIYLKTAPPPFDEDMLTCTRLQTSTRLAEFESYLSVFPNGKCFRFALTQVAELRPPSAPVLAADRYVGLATGQRFRLAVLENDRDALKVVSVASPASGAAQVTGDGGAIEFTAPASGPGNARFDYEAEGRGGTKARGTVEVAWLAPPGPPRPAGLIEVVGIWPQVGSVFKDCGNCPELVILPRGSFTMGSPDSEPSRDSDEGPQHRVTIDYELAVGKYEVTFNEWEACVAAGGCNGYQPADEGWGRGRRPVINVSWNDSQSYVQWLSRKTGLKYRLLSESEWEYAARGGTTTPFWTGQTITTDQANFDGNVTYNGSSKGVYRQKTVDVGSFRANPFGLHDVHGNVWEWVEDCRNDSYSGAPSNGSARTSGNCSSRVLRGGSWISYPNIVRSADRNWNGVGYRDLNFGFRLARTVF